MPEEIDQAPAQREAKALGVDDLDEAMSLVHGASSVQASIPRRRYSRRYEGNSMPSPRQSTPGVSTFSLRKVHSGQVRVSRLPERRGARWRIMSVECVATQGLDRGRTYAAKPYVGTEAPSGRARVPVVQAADLGKPHQGGTPEGSCRDYAATLQASCSKPNLSTILDTIFFGQCDSGLRHHQNCIRLEAECPGGRPGMPS